VRPPHLVFSFMLDQVILVPNSVVDAAVPWSPEAGQSHAWAGLARFQRTILGA
jgi:hypothetical protein